MTVENGGPADTKAHLFMGCWEDAQGNTEQALRHYVLAIREIQWDEQDPRQSPEFLLEQATNGTDGEQCLVAANPSTPVEGLEELRELEDEDIDANICSNPRCPTTWLDEYAENSSWRIRSGAASHPLTPLATLTKLASDSDQAIRTSVAFNYSTPSDILDLLASDSWSGSRMGVAVNIGASKDALRQLSNDAEADIAEKARHRLSEIH